MASRDDIVIEITPQVLLKAYACGIFPMAESADDPALYWIEPQQRGILLLDRVHTPKRLARTIRQGAYEVRIDSDFEGVIDGCAASRAGRRTTWINRKIRGLYRDLFEAGYCHTVEAWAGGRMVGGLYGVALNGAYFGESMFSTARDASKVKEFADKWGYESTETDWRKLVEEGKVKDARKNGSIVMYNQMNEAIARWDFVEAWPSKLAGPTANATNNEVGIEELEITHEGYKRVS